MRTPLMLALIALSCAAAALAQTSGETYPRYEVYVGFSQNRVATVPDTQPALFTTTSNAPAGFFDRRGLNGFDASVGANATRYITVQGDLFWNFGRKKFPAPFPCNPAGPRPCPDVCVVALTCPAVSFKTRESLVEFLGGIQLQDNSRETRFKPFAEFLIGGARISDTYYPNPDDPNSPTCTRCDRFTINHTGWAFDVGGGIDLRLNRNFDLRVVRLGYNPTRLGGATQHNLRFGFGIAVH